jgi:serine/threonine protein kinase
MLLRCAGGQILRKWQRAELAHCDLKPDNVGFDDEDNVYVLDVEGAVSLHRGAVTSGTRYTTRYAPPELLTADGGPNDTTDFYALGVMLRELVVRDCACMMSPRAGC